MCSYPLMYDSSCNFHSTHTYTQAMQFRNFHSRENFSDTDLPLAKKLLILLLKIRWIMHEIS